MHALAIPLLFAVGAIAQAPADPSADVITISGIAPAGAEGSFQAEVHETGENYTSYGVNCTGNADYCAQGSFVISTDPTGYTLTTDSDGNGSLDRDSECYTDGSVANCDVFGYDDNDSATTTSTESRSGTITLTLVPATTTIGDNPTTTRTTDVQITSTLQSTVTVPATTTPPPYASAPGLNSSSIIISAPVLTTGSNMTSPTIVRPSAPAAYTGAASSMRVIGATSESRVLGAVGGACVAVAALAFML
ncbi:hypothetical protein C1H76_5650 [Elsinoe australis]|uniref:Uncharacterized protein n=1 Tax=Elsinoe australis TaxID=40998 RepID=A0A4U7AYX2_9PEZI|nr:hypothetical protein C1H76_5650 [Elsinoe australis]